MRRNPLIVAIVVTVAILAVCVCVQQTQTGRTGLGELIFPTTQHGGSIQ